MILKFYYDTEKQILCAVARQTPVNIFKGLASLRKTISVNFL
jgi:hypothetical protein